MDNSFNEHLVYVYFDSVENKLSNCKILKYIKRNGYTFRAVTLSKLISFPSEKDSILKGRNLLPVVTLQILDWLQSPLTKYFSHNRVW